MNVYMYKADLYCEDCGRKICEDLTKQGRAPEDPDDEYSYDSDDFPKGPISHGGGEADSPWHCGAGDQCINADWCPAHGEDGGHKVGIFLENPLTSDGIEYVEECCKESLSRSKGCVALDVWAPFYGISLDEDPDLPMAE